MEEYLRSILQHRLGDRGLVKVETYYDKEREKCRRDCWMLKISINHKDITYIDEYYLYDLLFKNFECIKPDDLVSNYEEYIQRELLRRFYEKEES